MAELWKDKTKRTAFFACAAFLLLAVYAVVRAMQPGLWAEDGFFVRESENAYRRDAENAFVMSKRAGGADFDVTLNGRRMTLQLEEDARGHITLDYAGKTWRGEKSDGELYDEDGWPDSVALAFFTDETGEGSYAAEWIDLPSTLYRAYLGTWNRRGEDAFALIVVSFVLFVMGLLMYLFPQATAFLGHRWMYKDEPELSESGLLWQRIGAWALMGMAVVALFAQEWIR